MDFITLIIEFEEGVDGQTTKISVKFRGKEANMMLNRVFGV